MDDVMKKKKGILRSIINAVIFFFVLSIICFLVIQLVPGDPIRALLGESVAVLSDDELNALRDSYGLNDPVVVQYFHWLIRIFHGDFGTSITSGQPVILEIQRTIGTTLLLSLGAIIVIIVVSIPLGLLCAKFKDSVFDKIINGFCMFFTAMPNFWLGLLLIQFFAVKLNIFPAIGSTSSFNGMFLPCFTLGITFTPQYIKLLRQNILESWKKDFVRAARARGITETRIFWFHVLRDAFEPVLTLFGISLGELLAGATITEQIFTMKGMGMLSLDAIKHGDIYLIQAYLLLLGILIFISNALVDAGCRILNPAIKIRGAETK